MIDGTIQPRVVADAIDCYGNLISAYDIVKIISLPDYLFNEEHNGNYINRKYIGCVAIIRYQDMYDLDDIIWFDGNNILVEVLRERDGAFNHPEFTIPVKFVSKIKATAELYSLFIDYNKIGIKKNGNDGHLFINYDYINMVISTAVEVGPA